MKTMRKIMALVLTLAMALTLAIPALAVNTDPHTITITNASAAKHTYNAYQVFSGDLVDGKLTNIVWGSIVTDNGVALLNALKSTTNSALLKKVDDTDVSIFKDCESAADVAEVLSDLDLEKNADEAQAFADVVGATITTSTTVAGTSTGNETAATSPETGYTYKIPVNGDGYYLIKDASTPTTTTTNADGQEETKTVTNDSLTDYILKVTDDVSVVAKSSTVSVEKKVATGDYNCTEDHDHTAACFGYDDVNTAQIGDVVSFKLESTIPAEAAEYDYYYFIFGDKLSDGLTFSGADKVKVTINGTDATVGADKDYTVSTNYQTEKYTFAVALTDAKSHAGQKVVVTYEATVDTDATVGNTGNDNDVVVEFSQNPNASYGGTPDNDKSKPVGGFPGEQGTTPEGVTPEDTTTTYVAKIIIQKIDGDTKANLPGAEFAINGTTESVIIHTEKKYTLDNTSGTYYLLKSGEYTTTAPVTEKMVAIELANRDSATGGYVECKNTDSNVEYKLGDKYYRTATTEEISNKDITLYTHVASTEYRYASTTDLYKEETTSDITKCAAELYTKIETTGDDGQIVLNGLNAGTYTFTELVAPDGYNLLENPITVKAELVAKTDDDGKTVTDANGETVYVWKYTGGVSDANGVATVTVENLTGSVLPSTGGIGTTIFYAVGAVLVIGAGVLFITKKRMSGAED